MTVVVDASVVVAALVALGPYGVWAEQHLRSGDLVAPHSMPAEVTNVIRRIERTGNLSSEMASLAIRDLAGMPVGLYPFEPFVGRVWALRNSVSAYDAWYVAVAESIEAPLLTLDRRLASAPGPTCSFVIPD